ncbi:MAG: mechanosensitive ion channel, partial [Dehalococcoidia bacterium]|nr:mechanosensitive ion channel [Dehalococcoidia bacterium]
MVADLLDGTVRLTDLLTAFGILAGAALVAVLARWTFRRLEKRVQTTATTLDDLLLGALGTPVFLIVVILGLYFGLVYLPFDPQIEKDMRLWLFVALVAVGIFTLLKVLDAFYRWYAREVTATTKSTLDDRIVAILRIATPLAGTVLGTLLILRMLGVESAPIDSWLSTHGASIAIMIVFFMLVFFGVSRALPRVVKDSVRKGMAGQPDEEVQKRAETLAGVLVTTCQVIIIGAATLMILNELIPGRIAPLLAGVGVAGIAVGFGAQSLVKDVINGVFVIMEGQYHVGDWIGIAGIDGQVENINLRRTVLRDWDGAVHFVPNGEIRVASNFTKGYSRVNMDVSVAYDTDLDRAIKVINKVGEQLSEDPFWKLCIINPPHALRVEKLGDFGIDI